MKKWISHLFILTLLASSSSFANGTIESDLLKEIQSLKERLQALEQQMDERGTATVTSDRLSNPMPATDQDVVTVDSQKNRLLDGFALLKDNFSEVSIGGNIDVVGFYSDVSSGGIKEDSSDVIIDQVRLNIEVEVNDYVTGYIGLQFEDYDTNNGPSFAPIGGGFGATGANENVTVDEAYIRLSGEEGLYWVLGKQYLSFGNTGEYGHFINDTLARQFYETKDTGATIGYSSVGLDINVFAFNGVADEARTTGFDNKIDAWGGSVIYSGGDDDNSLKLGVSYIDNVFQAQNQSTATAFDTGLFAAPVVDDDNAAINGFVVATMGPLWFSGEYVAAINDLDRRDVPGAVKGQRPQALSIELAMTQPLGDRDYTIAVKWEENDDQVAFGNLVQSVWGLGASTNIYENTRLSLNWENMDLEGAGGHADLYLAEVSIGF